MNIIKTLIHEHKADINARDDNNNTVSLKIKTFWLDSINRIDPRKALAGQAGHFLWSNKPTS